jgi:hypothetical protein
MMYPTKPLALLTSVSSTAASARAFEGTPQ